MFILTQYASTPNSYAANIIELRCSYTYTGISSEKEIWRDSNGVPTYSKNAVVNKSQGKGVDFQKFTINGKYLKLETGKNIYSTKDSENKFGDWKNNDVNIKITNHSNENNFRIVADIKINKYELKVSEIISVDRVSGDYERSTESNGVIGDMDNNSQINMTIRTISNYESRGLCEKINRKF